MNGYAVIDLKGFDGLTTATIEGSTENAIEAVNSGKLVIVSGIEGVTPCTAECSISNNVVTVKTITKTITINNDVVSVGSTSRAIKK